MEPTENASDDKIDVISIVTDADRIHFISYQGESIEYMPLTLAEETEFSDSNESAIEYMLLKAQMLKARRGMDANVENPLLELKGVLGQLPQRTMQEIYAMIQLQRQELIEDVMNKITEHKEDFQYPEKDKFPRKSNPLDECVSFFKAFKGKPFTEVSQMTALQYFYYQSVFMESNIRDGNEQEYRMKKNAPKGGSGGAKAKPKTTGGKH